MSSQTMNRAPHCKTMQKTVPRSVVVTHTHQ